MTDECNDLMPELAPERIVRLEEGAVVVLDQRRLPDEELDLRCASVAQVEAIRVLAARGARDRDRRGVRDGARRRAGRGPRDGVRDARLLAPHCCQPPLGPRRDARRPDAGACRAHPRRRGGALSADGRARGGALPSGARVLTHCNAGGLATGGYGTALGAVRAAFDAGRVAHVWVGETRPLSRARLTAWELEQLGIPHAVIADGAAASFLGHGEVDLIVTGADRIAANGDTANKIGTYGLAVLAAHHGIPLVVVAPTSTLDPTAASGDEIPIEERDPAEVTARFPPGTPPST